MIDSRQADEGRQTGSGGIRRLASAIAACMALALGAASSAGASLPTVSSGELPGPPILYAPAPDSPPLSLQEPFRAQPLLVSGTDAYRSGEYLYQDYLFDDMGADTAPGGVRGASEGDVAATSSGNLRYPTADRYRDNAADLVELRIRPTAEAIVYRVTLNTAVQQDVAVVGIGIDTDAAGGPEVEWPRQAGITSPGLDRFVTAWGTGGEVAELPAGATTALPEGAVSMDTATNQMTIRVPRSLLDPGRDTWRHVLGAGLWDSGAERWKEPAPGDSPSEEQPASGGPGSAPGVFNLGFRFDEAERQTVADPTANPPIGAGIWFEANQAEQLATGSTGPYHQDIDFAKLEDGAVEDPNPPGRTQARIYPSSLGLPEGLAPGGFPRYGGPLQPYLLHLPEGHDPEQPAPLTFALHSLGGTYTQYAVFSPNYFRELGDERGSIVVTPHGHGTNGWYTAEAESDLFQVWADVARTFNLDPERTAISGYSMGGYGSYKLGVQYPDLWASAFTVVGPPGEGIWVPGAGPPTPGGPQTLTRDLLENVRWVPYLNWVAGLDELVPLAGPIAQQARFDELGLRSRLVIFPLAEHFTFALLDGWAQGRDFLGDRRRSGDPARVDYGFFPAANRPALGLVHDQAYWVSGLRARDLEAGDAALGRIRARSLAFGQGDPETQPITGAGADAGPPLPYTETGTEWTDLPSAAAENALEVGLENLAAAVVTGDRARLDGMSELRITVTSDGPSELRIDVALPPDAEAVRLDDAGVSALSGRAFLSGSARPAQRVAEEVALDEGGATIAAVEGTRTYLIRVRAAAEPAATEPDRAPRRRAADPEDEPSPRVGAAAEAAGVGEGELPFTGLLVWPLLLLAAALLHAGAELRRRL